MNLEEDINITNEYYKSKGICLVTKRPTPINVVHVDYTNGPHITDAYFEKQSSTDYNGIYREKYIDFEAKSTISKTSFSLSNITKHQIDHLMEVVVCKSLIVFTPSVITQNVNLITYSINFLFIYYNDERV